MKEIIALYSTHYKHLFHHVNRRVRNEADAEDILQEAMMRVIAYKTPDLIQNKTNWFYSLLNNMCNDLFRKRALDSRTFMPLDDLVDSMHPMEDVNRIISLREEVEERIAEIRAIANPIHRDVLTCFLLDGYSYRDISESYGLEEDHIRQIVKRFRSES